MLNELISKNTPLQLLSHPLFHVHGIEVWVKREELNHPQIQGNKLYKLYENLRAFHAGGYRSLLTFGGAYSNHLAAVAAAAHAEKIPLIGVVRGDELAHQPHRWSPTLQRAVAQGMHPLFVSRADYRALRMRTQTQIEHLQSNYAEQWPNQMDSSGIYWLPEGGSNLLAVQGVRYLAQALAEQCPDWSHLYCAVGTGATLAGLSAFSPAKAGRKICAVPVVKAHADLASQITAWIAQTGASEPCSWSWHSTPSKRYGQLCEQQRTFVTEIWAQFAIELDPIYTPPTFYQFWQDLLAQRIAPGSRVILLHSGGLQSTRTHKPEGAQQ
ncbi:MAG: pyridoxal-phosphate dependent enzyme [Thiotrichales bacterium]|nr:pyridoxal-phosphate dependent enzyme [Thiotrichales bacterium]